MKLYKYASGSSDEHSFMLMNHTKVLNLFENEIEALSYLSLLKYKESDVESVAVYKNNDFLHKVLYDYPIIEIIRSIPV